jgi:LssY-like putative type I secretion system component LssY
MGLLIRVFQRIAIFAIGAVSVWLIAFVIFDWADQKLPVALALGLTYAVGAYVILPYAVRMGLKFSTLKSVPSFTVAADGLPADPVNLGLIGTFAELRQAFAAIGWTEADKLDLESSWRMVKAFVLSQPYPQAPFSTLYLFGRGQDVGFQKAIGDSPRKRHHVRFWGKSLEHLPAGPDTAGFWLNTDRPAAGERVIWAGAATKDTGLGLTRLTFQVTHATDSDTNAERDFLIETLKDWGAIGEVTLAEAGAPLGHRVNHYVTDGDVAVAELEGAAVRKR